MRRIDWNAATFAAAWLFLAATALSLAGCQSAAPVNRPCGVIRDSLADVQGATPAMTRRIDNHFERGVAAGCWRRIG